MTFIKKMPGLELKCVSRPTGLDWPDVCSCICLYDSEFHDVLTDELLSQVTIKYANRRKINDLLSSANPLSLSGAADIRPGCSEHSCVQAFEVKDLV